MLLLQEPNVPYRLLRAYKHSMFLGKELFKVTGCLVPGSNVSFARVANLHQATEDWTLRNPAVEPSPCEDTTCIILRNLGLRRADNAVIQEGCALPGHDTNRGSDANGH